MRCARCGAANPEEARWCGQCYAPFAAAPGPARAEAAPSAPATPSAPRAVAAAPEDEAPGEVSRSGFRRRGETLEWQCVTCGEFNPLEVTSCAVCGTAMTARFETPEPAAEPSSWGAAFALSAVLPGTGHYLAGRLGSGIARALLYVVWLVGGLLLLLTAGSVAALAAVPLLAGAFVVWGGTLADLANVRRGDRELLTGRVLLWLVVGVTVLLLLGAVGGATRLR